MKQKDMRFEKEITVKVSLNYLLYLPEGYFENKYKKWPLILFLHGAGERGKELEKVKWQGLPKLLDEKDDFPFIVASPQCPDDTIWNEHFDALRELLSEIEGKYNVDKNRIYLTGMSMGGYGTWDLASIYPDKFAAIAPICGGSSYPYRLHHLKDVPAWVFHGAKDDVVPISESEYAVEALRSAGGNARFTVYPDAGHDSWTASYNNSELYEWLLGQERKA